MLNLIVISLDGALDLVFKLDHLEVVLELFELARVLVVFDGLALLPEAQVLYPLQQGFPENGLAIHEILLFAENVQIGALEGDASAHGVDGGYLDFLGHLLVPHVALHPFQEVHVNVVFCFGELLRFEDFVRAREEVDLGAVDLGEERLEQLEEDVFEGHFRQRSLFQNYEPFAIL